MASQAQKGFIPGSFIVNNVMLATEIIKGYNFAQISPRCVIKVDMMKVNDFVDYGFFLQRVLEELKNLQ